MDRVKETVSFLEKNGFRSPEVGIILGTGLGDLVNHMEIIHNLPYSDIPNFPVATVEFHQGRLIFGKLSGKQVIVMQGRFHYYEGYEMEEVVFPVRVMKTLGIDHLLIFNAGGNMNLEWKKGELMVIDDHINLQPDNPLRGKSAGAFGPIFTDMSAPYHPETTEKLMSISQKLKIQLNKGVFVAVAGPNLETRAEYRFLRQIGADVVGMSTVPEVIAANQMNLKVNAISVLTDNCDPDHLEPINIEDVIATAQKAEQSLIQLIIELLKEI